MKKSNFYEGQLLTPQDLNGLQDDVERGIDRVAFCTFPYGKIIFGFKLSVVPSKGPVSPIWYKEKYLYISAGEGFNRIGQFFDSNEDISINLSVHPNVSQTEKKKYYVALDYKIIKEDRTPDVQGDRPDIDSNEEEVLYVKKEAFDVIITTKQRDVNTATCIFLGEFKYEPVIREEDLNENRAFVKISFNETEVHGMGPYPFLHQINPSAWTTLSEIRKEPTDLEGKNGLVEIEKYDKHGKIDSSIEPIAVLTTPVQSILRAGAKSIGTSEHQHNSFQHDDNHKDTFVTNWRLSRILKSALPLSREGDTEGFSQTWEFKGNSFFNILATSSIQWAKSLEEYKAMSEQDRYSLVTKEYVDDKAGGSKPSINYGYVRDKGFFITFGEREDIVVMWYVYPARFNGLQNTALSWSHPKNVINYQHSIFASVDYDIFCAFKIRRKVGDRTDFSLYLKESRSHSIPVSMLCLAYK